MGRKRKYETPEQYVDALYERTKKYQQDHQEVRLFGSSKVNAKRRNLEFNITKEDIKELLVKTKKCPYLGCNITNISMQGRVWSNASLDRIDNTKGYTKDNIQIISDLANRMKQEATQEQLLNFAIGVVNLHSFSKVGE